MRKWLSVVMTVFLTAGAALAGLEVDLESGVVGSGYNDVQIPGNTGTRFSLSEDLETDPETYLRIRFSYTLRDRHTFSALVAPLRLTAEGRVNTAIRFQDALFPANTRLRAEYRFDSYRLTYRYRVLESPHWRLGFGLTAKIRDASIELASSTERAIKTNTGFVPLLNFLVHWRFAPHWRAVLEGDALAAPQGRAEDVLLALRYDPMPWLGVRAGYRMLEGGADNDEVYNFTWLHYAALGLVLHPGRGTD